MTRTGGEYYANKLEILADLFGAMEVRVDADGIVVDGRPIPVIDDVLIFLPPDRLPDGLRERFELGDSRASEQEVPFAPEVQRSFGTEWTRHPDLMEEHWSEFRLYTDLIDLESLADSTILDLGCGIGRWAYYVAPSCRSIVLVDFSDAVFVARRHLADSANAVFVLADFTDLPFTRGCAEVAFSLGTLHHLPVDALTALRQLAPLAHRHLVYLYYALDNRPAYFRVLLRIVDRLRTWVQAGRSDLAKRAFLLTMLMLIYVPLAALGRLAKPLGLAQFVPLGEMYAGKSLKRLRQDVFDRFMTPIEQRFSKREIETLADTFATITISDRLPYWHFVCESRVNG